MLITGIVKEKLTENIEEFINLFELETLVEMDIRLVKAVISAQNYNEINRYIAKYGYTISDSKILFRKILRSLS
jgi:predicted house-cleaning noncanonical NTP pyrophosphatase (MazG superfamily)